jgi:MFS family permease
MTVSDPSHTAQRKAFLGMAMASACGTVAYHSLLSNFLALFANQMRLSPAMIGLLFLAVQAPAVMQVLVARHVDRHGGKRLALTAFLWSPLTVLPLILSPQIGLKFGHAAAVWAIFAGVMAYALWNVGVGAAWMPLMRANLAGGQMTEMVGATNRAAMLSALCATLACSFFLGEAPALWRFQVIFILGAVIAGARGLYFRHVRDVETHPDAPREPVWEGLRALWANEPYRRLIIFTAIAYTAGGLVGPFRPLFITAMGFSERFAAIVTLPLVLGVFGLMSPVWGALADRYGSRGVYVIGGVGVMLGHLVLVLPTGHTLGDGALMALSLLLGAAFWGGFDSGNVKRLFTVVPRQRQSLYMAVYMLVSSGSIALGAFFGGQIIRFVRILYREPSVAQGFDHCLDHRILYLVAAAWTVLAIGYSRRMRDLPEVSASRLLLYMRIRTQRWLTDGLPGDLWRWVTPEDDKDESAGKPKERAADGVVTNRRPETGDR